METLRTPDDRFTGLPDWPWEPRYAEVPDPDGGVLRVAAVDEGPRDAPVVLLLHGEPSWSFLYRTVIPPLLDAGLRVVAPDLVGFGRSDKPARVADHSYARHLGWLRAHVLDTLHLTDVTLVCQDWGGLLGLRLVAEHPDRFARVVACNTGLPTGDQGMPEPWWDFRRFVERVEDLPVGTLVDRGCRTDLAPEVRAAYDAPFPDASYKAGPKAMPLLVPTAPDDPETEANRAAWQALTRFTKPFVCAFGDSDPITGAMAPVLQRAVPGAAGQPHTTLTGAAHFAQEDAGPELARVVVETVRRG